jgi:hypothetical protein
MKKHTIVGKFSSHDKTNISKRNDEDWNDLNLIDSKGKLNYGIGEALVELSKMGIFPSEIGIDLLILAIHVQAADKYISRETESQDTWTREINLIVPVSDVAKWDATSNILKRTLDFLTGDIWTLHFRKRPKKNLTLAHRSTLPLVAMPFDCLSLFSGGLDSLIGAIDLLESKFNPLFISHVGESYTSSAQNACFNSIKSYYSEKQFNRLRGWINPKIEKEVSTEKTTRGRSFLFFSIGVFAGSGFSNPFTLRVPENGLIALNVPLDPLRLGSHSTHTTHPFYIARWNEILKILQIKGEIVNPYWDKTKGEMIANCENRSLLSQIAPNPLSCSSPAKGRWKGKGVQHCGYCLPCLIRRAAFKKGFGADSTSYHISNLSKKPLNSLKAEGQQIRSFQFAIDQLENNTDISKILIHKSGPLLDESPEHQQALASVYERGMKEVEDVLANVKTKSK